MYDEIYKPMICVFSSYTYMKTTINNYISEAVLN